VTSLSKYDPETVKGSPFSKGGNQGGGEFYFITKAILNGCISHSEGRKVFSQGGASVLGILGEVVWEKEGFTHLKDCGLGGKTALTCWKKVKGRHRKNVAQEEKLRSPCRKT